MKNLIPQHLFEMSKHNMDESLFDLYEFLFYIKHNSVSFNKNIKQAYMRKINADVFYNIKHENLVDIFNKQEFIDYIKTKFEESHPLVDTFTLTIHINQRLMFVFKICIYAKMFLELRIYRIFEENIDIIKPVSSLKNNVGFFNKIEKIVIDSINDIEHIEQFILQFSNIYKNNESLVYEMAKIEEEDVYVKMYDFFHFLFNDKNIKNDINEIEKLLDNVDGFSNFFLNMEEFDDRDRLECEDLYRDSFKYFDGYNAYIFRIEYEEYIERITLVFTLKEITFSYEKFTDNVVKIYTKRYPLSIINDTEKFWREIRDKTKYVIKKKYRI